MKHETLIRRMTVEEKAAILSGKNEWQSLPPGHVLPHGGHRGRQLG